MRKVKLYPVREAESDNFQASWKRREQVLGSLLHWAHDAGASLIEFDPTSHPEPFSYFAMNGDSVTTELGPTPSDLVPTFASFVRDIIDGHPMLRPLRRVSRRLTRNRYEAEFEVPPTSKYAGSSWICTMDGDSASFKKQNT